MGKQKEITQEMLEDLSKMGDKDWAKKYNTFRQYPIRLRKRLGIKSFNKQHNLREHRFIDGVEHKYCPREGGHWNPISAFGRGNNRYDGLRGICLEHERQQGKYDYHVTGTKKELRKVWLKTESGKASLRNTWRKEKAKKDNAYIIWLPEHEQRAYEYFGGRCSYCGKSVEFLKVEFDHFVPITKGGKTHPNNMLPCCKKCNHGVGGKFNKEALGWLHDKFGELNGNMIYLVCQTALAQLGDTK